MSNPADKITAELMALADAYGYACHECRGSPEGTDDTTATRAALEQAIRRAVDWGPERAFLLGGGRVFVDVAYTTLKGAEDALKLRNDEAPITPLYARSQA